MGNISVIKRIVIIVVVVILLCFWVRSIFSARNLPGKEVKYTYSSGVAANSENKENAKIKKEEVKKRPPPPKKVAEGTKGDGHIKGKVANINIQPPPNKTGKGPQPIPPPVPVTSPAPPPVLTKSPAPPPDIEEMNPVDKGSVPEKKTSPISAKPDSKSPKTKTPDVSGQKGNKKVALLTIPGESDLKTYFDWRLNIQIKCPKKWLFMQSTTLPEFSCTSRQADNFKLTCRRQRIMKNRKFSNEVKTILGYETTGRAVENEKKHTRKIGKHQLAKFIMDEYELDINSTKKMKSKLTFLFIEADDEIVMFFFEVPYEYAKKANPLVNKMIKSIKVVKRPEPSGAGSKK
ncbi:MAG: hypothetical protein K8T10_19810 [Candidatus Eremiobacteraeota bacterium]|nr:hypothetical protein [Candidatus Eremiobacteraeota bacterium]